MAGAEAFALSTAAVRAVQVDVGFGASMLIVGLISYLALWREARRRDFSLLMCLWLFSHFFFFVAPLAQWNANSFPWGRLESTSISLLTSTNLYLIAWLLLIYIASIKWTQETPVPRPRIEAKLQVASRRIPFLLIISLLFISYVIASRGATALFLRGARHDATATTLDLVIFSIGHGSALAAFFLALAMPRSTPTFNRVGSIMITGLVCLVANFPGGMPRFMAAAITIAVLINIGTFDRRGRLPAMIALGLLVVMPLLNATRRSNNLSDVIQGLSRSFDGSRFLSPDFDAYTMTAHTVEYVSVFGHSAGQQLLTVLGFFVPRSFWPGKSVGSGYFVAQNRELSFTNVSSPLPAESLINGGPVALLAAALLCGVVISSVDAAYWAGRLGPTRVAVYPLVVGLSFFINRGDLLSSISYSVGICSVVGLGLLGALRLRLSDADVVSPHANAGVTRQGQQHSGA